MNRIAILSDIHGNLPALEAVLGEVARCSVDAIVNLGDILSGPLWPAETADRLMRLDLPTVAGNHERQLLTLPADRMGATDRYTVGCLREAHRSWLAGLPAGLWLAPDVLCCHGTPASDLEYWLETVTPDFGLHGSTGLRPASPAEVQQRLGEVDASLVLCGHTHVPREVGCGDTLVVNPGSVGLQAYDDEHPSVHWVEMGSPHARWALAERQALGWAVQQFAVPYDWEAAAAQAIRHGRPDWAHALWSGRVGPVSIGA